MCKLKKYEDLWEECVRKRWITNVFPIEVRYRGFITNSTSGYFINIALSPLDKRKYIKKIQDKAQTASALICHLIEWRQSNKVWWYRELLLGRSGFVVMMLRPRNYVWTQSHHLMKALLEAMLLYKHQSLYDTYIYIYIYIYMYILQPEEITSKGTRVSCVYYQ